MWLCCVAHVCGHLPCGATPRREPHNKQAKRGSRTPLAAPVLEDSGAEMPHLLLGLVHSYTCGPFPLGWAPCPVRIQERWGGAWAGQSGGEARAISEQPILACRGSISGSGRIPLPQAPGFWLALQLAGEEGARLRVCTGELQN